MTPFIDVMLVLLIIFMVAAPLATVDIAGRPAGARPPSRSRARTAPVPDPARRPVAAPRRGRGRPRGLAAALDAASAGDRETRVFLRADRSVSYGEVVAVMNGLRAAGYLKLALVGLDSRPGAPSGTMTPGVAPPSSPARAGERHCCSCSRRTPPAGGPAAPEADPADRRRLPPAAIMIDLPAAPASAAAAPPNRRSSCRSRRCRSPWRSRCLRSI